MSDDEIKDEYKAIMREGIESARRLAVSMLNGFAANAFEKPPTAKDIAYYKAVIAERDADLEELDRT